MEQEILTLNSEIVEANILEDFKPVNLIFKSQTLPTAIITEYLYDIPEDVRVKIRQQLIDRHGKDASIMFEGTKIIVTTK